MLVNRPIEIGMEPDREYETASIWLTSPRKLHVTWTFPQEHSVLPESQFLRPLILIPIAAIANLCTSWLSERVSWSLVSTSIIHIKARLSGEIVLSNDMEGRRDCTRVAKRNDAAVLGADEDGGAGVAGADVTGAGVTGAGVTGTAVTGAAVTGAEATGAAVTGAPEMLGDAVFGSIVAAVGAAGMVGSATADAVSGRMNKGIVIKNGTNTTINTPTQSHKSFCFSFEGWSTSASLPGLSSSPAAPVALDGASSGEGSLSFSLMIDLGDVVAVVVGGSVVESSQYSSSGAAVCLCTGVVIYVVMWLTGCRRVVEVLL